MTPQEYSLPVDIWSTGCIIAEMACGAALFMGDCEIDTLFKIFQKLGTPTYAEWPGLEKLKVGFITGIFVPTADFSQNPRTSNPRRFRSGDGMPREMIWVPQFLKIILM